MKGAYLTNEKGKVAWVQGDVDQENRCIVVQNKNGKIGQSWDIIYADEYPPELKKGDLNKDWGMVVGEMFHVISNLPSGRYLDRTRSSRNLIIKTRNGYTTQ
jgi:hypothetical protein